MRSEYPYGTFSNYSPRGKSDLSKRSKRICGGIKAGKISLIESCLPHLAKSKARVLRPFLNPEVTLVPIPRSAPLAENALWPSKVIADVLAQNGYGSEVLPLLERVKAVPKSSTSESGQRPLIHDHMETLAVRDDMLVMNSITLVDDVLTKGSTSVACANLLQERFPGAEIRVFAMIRTQGFVEDIEKIVDPAVGKVIGHSSGKPFRDP